MQDDTPETSPEEPDTKPQFKPAKQLASKPENENSTFRLIRRAVVVVSAATISTIVAIITFIGLFFSNLLDRPLG
ncbi:hypothetical protein [Roseobacter sp. MH60115]|uniref:hypothetical protein n=1 Tax=Roseobacter sp. MH60115 TaxID=2785324 RepID=UPI0018A30990|nr:hypothetical protein [Roseobacter sp. MH60115]